MTSKFGENGEQFERFLEFLPALRMENVAGIVALGPNQDMRSARDRLSEVPVSAARLSALQSAEEKKVSEVLKGMEESAEEPLSTFTEARFVSLLTGATRAIALRPQLDDETVGLLVDPFAELVRFEWRSWGVSSAGDLGPAPSAA